MLKGLMKEYNYASDLLSVNKLKEERNGYAAEHAALIAINESYMDILRNEVIITAVNQSCDSLAAIMTNADVSAKSRAFGSYLNNQLTKAHSVVAENEVKLAQLTKQIADINDKLARIRQKK